MNEDVDYDAAVDAVISDMGKAALKFKARRYEPKQTEEAPAEPAPAEAEPTGPTASELESLLGGG